MSDTGQSTEQLLAELAALRRRVAELESPQTTEQDAHTSAANYRLFVEHFQGIAYQAEVSPFHLIMFHGLVEEMTGYTPDDFLQGKIAWDTLIHPDDRALFYDESRKLATAVGYVAEPNSVGS